MKTPIKTRCKFRVVSVESFGNTQRVVNSTEEGYDEIDAPECTQEAPSGGAILRRYKIVNGPGPENVKLAATYDVSNPEDVSFAEATPSGDLKIYVSNPKVIGTFIPGKNYYLDLTPCE